MLEQFIAAHERCDAPAAMAIAAQDIRITMPPNQAVLEGLATIAPLMQRALSDGEWRLVATRANRMPTAASYLRRPGDSEFRAFKFDVLRVFDGTIAEITTFGAGMFPAFGLPRVLAAES